MMAAGGSAVIAAVVVGNVHYREGEGVLRTIPPGNVSVEVVGPDAVFSWADESYRGTAATPFTDFRECVLEGAIWLLTVSASSAPGTFRRTSAQFDDRPAYQDLASVLPSHHARVETLFILWSTP